MPFAEISVAAVIAALTAGVFWWRAERVAAERMRALARERRRSAEGERFLGRLAHDLRSPLSVVSLALQDDARRSRSRELAHAALRDIDAVLERCMSAALLADGPPTLQLETVAVDRVITRAVSAHRASGRIELDGEPLQAVSDERALRIVCTNLIDNAVAYGAADRPVVVRWRVREHAAQRAVEIVVVNAVGRYGTPDPERAFDRFHRGARAAGVTGAGLGLYLARAFAEHLGGRLALETSADEVRAVVELPC